MLQTLPLFYADENRLTAFRIYNISTEIIFNVLDFPSELHEVNSKYLLDVSECQKKYLLSIIRNQTYSK